MDPTFVTLLNKNFKEMMQLKDISYLKFYAKVKLRFLILQKEHGAWMREDSAFPFRKIGYH